jgi:hypothetical protein
MKMSDRKKSIHFLGQLIFLIGILSGALLSGMFVWVNLEHYLYGFDSLRGKPIHTLKCPLIMTKSETGKVRVSFKNDLDQTSEFNLRADFSTSTGGIESTRTKVSIEPGKTQQYEWEVTSSNVTRHIFIFAKVFAYASYKLPFREASCGIWVVNVPYLTGQQIFILLFTFTLLGITIGQVSLELGEQAISGNRLNIQRLMRFWAFLVLLALFACLQGWLLPGIILLIAIVLMGVIFGISLLSQL